MAFVYFFLPDKDIVNMCIVPCFYKNGAPDARCDQTRSPIPSVMIACLAGEDADLLIEYSAILRLVIGCFVMIGKRIPFRDIHFDG